MDLVTSINSPDGTAADWPMLVGGMDGVRQRCMEGRLTPGRGQRSG